MHRSRNSDLYASRLQSGGFLLLAVLCQSPHLSLQEIYGEMGQKLTFKAARNHILSIAVQPSPLPFVKSLLALLDVFIALGHYTSNVCQCYPR